MRKVNRNRFRKEGICPDHARLQPAESEQGNKNEKPFLQAIATRRVWHAIISDLAWGLGLTLSAILSSLRLLLVTSRFGGRAWSGLAQRFFR